jgi:hypothetical protein
MTTATITSKKTIRARCQLREDFAGMSTGNNGSGYYESKGEAVRAYEKALNDYDLCFNPDDFMQMPGDEGRISVDIWTMNGADDDYFHDCVGSALLMWYRMPSGRYEFTGYIA